MKHIIIGTEGKSVYGKYILEYILRLTYPNIEIIYEHSDSCHLIFRSVFLRSEPKWNKQPKPYIYWSGETRIPKQSPLQTDSIALLTLKPRHIPNLCYCPYIIDSPYLK